MVFACVDKISMANITTTNWFTLTDIASLDAFTWADIISANRLPEQTL